MRGSPLAAVNAVALAIGRFSSLNEMLDYSLGKVLEVVRADAGSVYLLDEARGELKLAVQRGYSREVAEDLDHLKLGEGLSGRVTMTGAPIVVPSVKDDPRVTRASARGDAFRAFACVPLRSPARIHGTLNVLHTSPDRQFSSEDIEVLTIMALQIGLAVANTRLYLDLLASERRFRNLVENAEDLIYLLDPDARLVYANPALARLLADDALIGAASGRTLLDLVDAADRDRVAAVLADVLAGQVVRGLEFRFAPREGGNSRQLSQTMVPIRDEDGAVSGMQCIARDVTDREQMRARMAQAERLVDLGRVATSIAHEIRNPLGAIVNCIGILRRPGASIDPRLLDIVTEEAEAMDAAIGEFLMFARPPTKAAVPCDVTALVDDTLALFRQRGTGAERWHGRPAARPIEIEVRGDEGLPKVLADPTQMRQVFWNLLSNAADAMPDGGRIDVCAGRAGGTPMVTVSVSDEGPGVGDPRSIFEPFFTTKAHGTGLGLAVVARVVRDHSGHVAVENLPGRGARFTVALPIAEQAAANLGRLSNGNAPAR